MPGRHPHLPHFEAKAFLETEAVALDSMTMTPDNFQVMAVGTKKLIDVENVRYFPLHNTIELTFNAEIHYAQMPFNITTSGMKDCDGNEVTISDSVYLRKCLREEPYGVSISEVLYKSEETFVCYPPLNKPYSAVVRVVNGSKDSKEITLVYYTSDDENEETVLESNKVIVPAEGSIIDMMKTTVKNGETVLVKIA